MYREDDYPLTGDPSGTGLLPVSIFVIAVAAAIIYFIF